MTPRMKCAQILAGLVAMVAMLSSGIEVYAAGSVIKVTGGYKPGTGDPPLTLSFKLFWSHLRIHPAGRISSHRVIFLQSPVSQESLQAR